MKKLSIVVVLIVGLLMGSLAQAGYKVSLEVSINTATRFASGTLGAIRNSADSTQYIVCWGQSNGVAACFARNANGVTASCASGSPTFWQLVMSIKGDSYVNFYWNTDGSCSSLMVNNASYYPPK